MLRFYAGARFYFVQIKRIFTNTNYNVTDTGDTFRLKTVPAGQVFKLRGDKLSELNDGEDVDIQAHLDAQNIPSLKDSDLFEVVIDKIHASVKND